MDCQKVIIVRRFPEDDRRKTGLGIYSDNVDEALVSENIPHESVFFRMNLSGGYFALIGDYAGHLKNSKKYKCRDCVYHVTDELGGLLTPLMAGKIVVTVHHVPAEKANSWFFINFWRFTTKLACGKADVVIAASPQTKSELITKLGVPGNKIVSFYSVIRPIFVPKNLPRKKIIGYVGSLICRKNCPALIEAFALFVRNPDTSDYLLKICGKGEEHDKIVNLIEELNLSDKVELISELSNEEIVDFYNTVSVLANPSMHEGLGLTTLEAQKCNTPVVFFEDADIPEEVTKYAVPAKNIRDFADKMHDLAVDEEFRSNVVKTAKEYADGFGKDFQKNLAELYRKTANNR